MKSDDLLRKIRALRAKAADSSVTRAESTSFAAKADELERELPSLRADTGRLWSDLRDRMQRAADTPVREPTFAWSRPGVRTRGAAKEPPAWTAGPLPRGKRRR